MLYDKDEINLLFIQYVTSENKEGLEELVMACSPMVVAVLSRYENMRPYHEDIIQEVLLRLWQNFQSKERLLKESEHPHVWLFKKVRDHIITVTRQHARQHGLPMTLTDREKEILDMRDVEHKTFEDIAQTLKLHIETVKCYYSIAHSKLDSAINISGHTKSLLEHADCSNLDPAKRYEMKDLHRAWREKLHTMAISHPNIGSSKSASKTFHRYADDLLGKDNTDD